MRVMLGCTWCVRKDVQDPPSLSVAVDLHATHAHENHTHTHPKARTHLRTYIAKRRQVLLELRSRG